MGGKLYGDTSIVLNHIGKIPYTLWDVEVQKKPAPQSVEPPAPGFDLKG